MSRVVGRLDLVGTNHYPQPVTEGIPFLGFVIYPTYRRLKRRKGINYRRSLNQRIEQYHRNELELDAVSASLQGWVNHVRYGQTYGLRKSLVRDLVIEPAQRLRILNDVE